ncbi:PspC domain-containing protein [Flavobacterium sp. WC2509]|uniref:PspC domain-containing protein n=1 Tax=Flavobacterium sp. WC2509 TaxID=3461406 RepID=UPI004043B802
MNKTVNINLGGMFFHIDEDAYQKLTRYFEAIKRSLSKSSGQEEIIKDIEMRVSELLTEKQKSEKHVVTIREVDEVIAVMGQPEDYIIEDDGPNSSATNDFYAPRALKKLYRDKENGMIGGVATGLGHYFGIEAVWLKVIFLICVFAGFGTGIVAYIILWIVTPEAVTTTEKLEMTGEPVTISNIEKKVREEFDNVSDKIKNADYDKYGNQIRSEAGKLGNGFSDFIMTVFKIFAKFLGVILIMGGLSVLVLLFIGVFTLGTSVSIDFPWQNYIEAGNFTDYPIWVFGLLMFLAVGIPFFFMTLLGFKLLAPNMKSVGNIVKYTLLAVWLIAVSIAISIGIRQVSAFAVNGRTVHKETIPLHANDTLYIKFRHNDYFAKDVDDRKDVMITKDSLDNDIIYSNQVGIRIEKSDEKYAYIQIEKEAKGSSLSEAKKRSEAIRYGYQIIGNKLILDNYLITDAKNKFRDQEIEITLFLPKGTLLKPDDSMAHYDRTNGDYFLWNPGNNEIYRVEQDLIECISYEEDNHNDDNESNITINKNGVTIEGDSTVKSKKNFKELKINKDGIIIKTE